MWKLAQTPRRRRLVLDPLEGRQLLSGLPFMGPVVGPESFGATMGSAWIQGSLSPAPGPMAPAVIDGPSAWGQPDSLGEWGRGPSPDKPGPSFAAPSTMPGHWDNDHGAPTQVSTSTPLGGSAPSGGGSSAPPTLPMAPSSPSGSSNSALSTGASSSQASTGTPNLPVPSSSTANPTVEINPLAHALEPSASPFGLSQLFWFQSMTLNATRDRSDSTPPGVILAAPFDTSTTTGLIGPQGSPAAVNPATTPTTTSPGPMASAIVPVGQSPNRTIGGDPEATSTDLPDTMSHDNPSRGGPRAAAHSTRGGRLAGRSHLAEASLSDVDASTDVGDLAPAHARAGEIDDATRGADLIADALPIAGESLERSLEDFVRQLETVDVGAIVTHSPTPAAFASITVAGVAASSVVARELARRRSRRGLDLRVLDPLGRELALSFPELPRSWSR